MAKSRRYPTRRLRRPFFHGQPNTLGLLILLGAMGCYSLIQVQSNRIRVYGKGSSDWVMGKSQTHWDMGFGNRSLEELKPLALELVNRDRRVNGLPPLVEDPLLNAAAQGHAEDMLARQFYAHVNPDGRDPSDRFQAVGGKTGAGENILQYQGGPPVALTFRLVEDYQRQWMYSAGHRQNLLTADYETFGYGIAANTLGTEVYAVQMFSFRAR